MMELLNATVPFIPLRVLDLIAFAWFLGVWTAYAHYADVIGATTVNLLGVMNHYRLNWMRQMMKRENRIVDATMIGNLLRSISFFASTTILIIFALLTLLGYRDEGTRILSSIPYAMEPTPFLWEFKIFIISTVFIYAFFKFTWSLRQYNYACAFVAGAPPHNTQVERHEEYAQKGAYLLSNAARHFNMALRAYYFGLAALSWFINAWVFLLVTSWVVYVVYRREFRSHTLNNLLIGEKKID